MGGRQRKMGIRDGLLEQSLDWADDVLGGKKVKRKNEPGKVEKATIWSPAVSIARKTVRQKLGSVSLSPYVALDLIDAAKSGTKKDAFTREDQAIEDLSASDQFHASIYAFNLVQKHAKKPSGAPDKTLAVPVTKVGVLRPRLLESQIAVM